MQFDKLAFGIGVSGLSYIVGTLLSSPAAVAQATINTLFSFNGTNGAFPIGGVVEDSQGNLFGTASGGGSGVGLFSGGTVFEYTPGSGLTTLASFTNGIGIDVSGGLLEDSQGNLFGTASGGEFSNGNVFEYTPGSGLSSLAFFNGRNGNAPIGGVVEDSQGNLFGTTRGELFKYTPGSGLSILGFFNGTNGTGTNIGSIPSGGLSIDSQGNLFGTTSDGGASNRGTVFEYTPGSGLTTLASFNGTNGSLPLGGVVEDSFGNLFGTTAGGGASDDGTVFEYTPGSGLTTLASFNGTNGSDPFRGRLVEDSFGNLFGTTYTGGASNYGTLFEVSTNTQSVPEPDFVLGALVAIGAFSLRSTGKRGKRQSLPIRTPECHLIYRKTLFSHFSLFHKIFTLFP